MQRKLGRWAAAVGLTAALLLCGNGAFAVEEGVLPPPEEETPPATSEIVPPIPDEVISLSVGEEGYPSEVSFKATNFDSATGILTMTLKYRVGDGNLDGAREDMLSCFFGFQVDLNALIPLKRVETNDKPLTVYGNGAYMRLDEYQVGKADVLTGNIDENHQLNAANKAKAINKRGTMTNGLDLNSKLSTQINPNSYYVVSLDKTSIGNDMADCFLRINMVVPGIVDADGYVTIGDFKFLCVGGTDAQGQAIPATTTDELNKNSIVIPTDEAKFLENLTIGGYPIADGICGYLSCTWPSMPIAPDGVYGFSVGSALPAEWLNRPDYNVKQTNAADWAKPDYVPIYEPIAGLEKNHVQTIAPTQMSYPNDDLLYTVTGLRLDTANTFGTTESDFPTPVGLAGGFIRYTIPTEVEESQWPSGTAPHNYTNGAATVKSVDLKYKIWTEVTSNSLTTPEDANKDQFLSDLTWQFTTPAGVPLQELVSVDSTGGIYTIAVGAKQYYVQKNPDGSYSPAGLLLEKRNGEVEFYKPGQEATLSSGIVPQLIISSKAAKKDSYLWAEGTDWGTAYLRACYTSTFTNAEGVTSQKSVYSEVLSLRFFRTSSVATKIDLDAETGIGTVTLPGEGTVAGFEVGTQPDVNKKDRVMRREFYVMATVYDQYGIRIENEKLDFQIIPESGEASKFVFAVDPIQSTKAYIEYASQITPDKIRDAKYTITATSQASSVSATKTVYIDRPTEKLNSIEVAFTGAAIIPNYIGQNEVPSASQTFNGRIPICKWSSDHAAQLTQTITMGIRAAGINSQFSVFEKSGIADLTVVPHTSTGAIDMARLAENGVQVAYYLEDLQGKEITAYPQGYTLDKNTGVFTVDSTAQNFEFVYTISVTYDGVAKYAKGRINMTREKSYMERIQMREWAFDVPTYEQKKNEYFVMPVAYDQYNTRMTWAQVDEANKGYNFVLKINVLSGSLPAGVTQDTAAGIVDGITQSGAHFVINNETAALSGTSGIRVQASYSNLSSNVVYISTDKEWSKLTYVSTINYENNGSIKSPGIGKPDVTSTPSYILRDQYYSIMNSGDFDISWDVNQSGEYKTTADPNFYKLDRITGLVTVKTLAKPGRIYARVTFSPKSVPQGETEYRVPKGPFLAADITRYDPIISTAEILTTEITRPIASSSASWIQLVLKAASQYGEGEDIPTSLRWSILSVQTLDGTTQKSANPNGDDVLGAVQMDTANGQLNFRGGQSDRSKAPAIVKVKVTFTNGVTATQDIRVIMAESVPTQIYIYSMGAGGFIQVPDAGAPANKLQLTAVVQDQYGLDIPGAVPLWQTTKTNQGVALQGNVISADSTANNCVVYLICYYEFNFNGEKKTIDNRSGVVKISRGEPVISGVRVVPLESDIPLPAEREGVYKQKLTAIVYDQFGVEMPSEPVKWELLRTSVAGAKITVDTATGIASILYSDGLRDAGRSSFDVIATAGVGSKAKVSPEATFNIQRQQNKPTYAVIEIKNVAPAGRVNPNGAIVVPGTGEGPSIVTIGAKVYSQYKELMPNEKAEFYCPASADKIELKESAPGEIVLHVKTGASAVQYIVYARPDGYGTSQPGQPGMEDMDPGNGKFCKLAMRLYRGTAAATSTELHKDNPTEIQVPLWDPLGDYKPDLTTKTPAKYTLAGRTIDQYEVAMDPAYGKTTWKLNPVHKGVTLVPGEPDNDAWVKATITVTNDAMWDTSAKDTITAIASCDKRVSISNSVILKLTKQESTPTFIFWDGVDELGWTLPLEVPNKLAMSVDTTLKAKVYDQYGYELKTAKMAWDFDREIAESMGLTVKNSDNEDGVSKSELYQNGMLVATLETETGIVTVYYTAASMSFLPIMTTCEGASQNGRLSLSRSELYAAEITLTRAGVTPENSGDYTISSSDEPFDEDITSKILDQYSRIITNRPSVRVEWSLWFMDEKTKLLVPYVEYNSDQSPKAPEEYFLRIAAIEGSNRVGKLSMFPEFLDKATEAVVRATVVDADGTPVVLPGGETLFTDVTVKFQLLQNAVEQKYIVKYAAGAQGKLSGEAQEQVKRGEMPRVVPEVIANEGYEFIGWSMDGTTIVEPTTVYIRRAVTFTALYEEVKKPENRPEDQFVDTKDTPGVFLKGYPDGTVGPEKTTSYSEVIKMLVVGLELYDSANNYGDPTGTGADNNAWYKNYLACAEQNGIFTEADAKMVSMSGEVTRADAALLLCRALGIQATQGGEAVFADIPEDFWANGYIEALYEKGIINGCDGGETFRPDRSITRCELTKMIACAKGFNMSDSATAELVRNSGIVLPDVPVNHWSYGYILEAMGALQL